MEDMNKIIKQQMTFHNNTIENNWLDFSHVIVPNGNNEMNVICQYNPSYLQKSKHHNNNNNHDNLFYGVSPEISSTFIINAIKKQFKKMMMT